jgi:hypothetical protein
LLLAAPHDAVAFRYGQASVPSDRDFDPLLARILRRTHAAPPGQRIIRGILSLAGSNFVILSFRAGRDKTGLPG